MDETDRALLNACIDPIKADIYDIKSDFKLVWMELKEIRKDLNNRILISLSRRGVNIGIGGGGIATSILGLVKIFGIG